MPYLAKFKSSFTLQSTATDIDAMSVVGDLKQFEPSILDDNLERSRASIDSVFDQLLQCMNRGNYNFAGSNLVDNILIKSLDKAVSCGSALGLFRTCYYPDPLWGLGS